MKIRFDFVTNSSSSCYVMFFDKDIKEVTDKEFNDMFVEKYKNTRLAKEAINTLRDDSQPIDEQDISYLIDILANEVYWSDYDLRREKYGSDDAPKQVIDDYECIGRALLEARKLGKKYGYRTRQFEDCYSETPNVDAVLDLDELFEPRENIIYISQH